MTLAQWLTSPGQCLTCGGRGGWTQLAATVLCSRCEGTGRDPARGTDWYADIVLPIQITYCRPK